MNEHLHKDAPVNGLRKDSEQNRFPYKGIGRRSYFEVCPDGAMRQPSAVAQLRAAIPNAKAGQMALLEVWTGQYRYVVFYLDAIDASEKAEV